MGKSNFGRYLGNEHHVLQVRILLVCKQCYGYFLCLRTIYKFRGSPNERDAYPAWSVAKDEKKKKRTKFYLVKQANEITG